MVKNEPLKHEKDSWYINKIQTTPSLKDVTKELYIMHIEDFVKTVKAKSFHNLLIYPKKYIEIQTKSDRELNSRVSQLRAVLSLLKHSGLQQSHPILSARWRKHSQPIVDELDRRNKKNEPTERQAVSFYDWKTILEKRDSLPYGSLDHLILSLHTYVPPRRQWDYARLRVYTDPKVTPKLDHNHLHLNCKRRKGAYIFLNEYKTARFYKDFMNKDIPVEFLKVIEASMKNKPRKYLIEMAKGGPYEMVNSFTQRVNRSLKKVFDNPGMGVNSLRHSFSSLLYKMGNLTLEEWEYYARKMGHSIMQSQKYAFIKEWSHDDREFAELKGMSEGQKRESKDAMDLLNKDMKPRCFMRMSDGKLVEIDCPE